MTTVMLVVTVIVAVAFSLLLICVVVARVVFLPQIVMIEGQSAGNALGRAIRLGKGNWYRVGAIALFTYFVSASLLAAFSNALLTEYNSGAYGKGKVDDRIPGLLMRVDEQADPIDKPLPVVDDRLDAQALERIALPEQQVVPYLAILISTIYGDAEKAFGRDKAKKGYKVAQQSVFGADASTLGGVDLAGKLPKV